jgi:sugar transferase (PEP-CTERM/EpsH1 system associated)
VVTPATSVEPAPEPLRVMHVVYSLEPGGMEFGVVKLVNGFDRRRVSSAVCATVPGGRLRSLVAADVPVFELTRRRGNDPRLIWRLARLFRRERPNVVHTHAWGTLLEGLLAAKLAGVPLVVHGEHGTLQLKPRQRWLQRWGWARVNQVLSVSSTLATRIAAETGFPAERVHTIRNGVDLARFCRVSRSEARAALGLADTDIVIGSVGRLVPVKDQATLIDAVARVARSNPDVRLLLAGDGPLRYSLEARAAVQGVGDRVTLLGHRSDVETVLNALDVFALSSTSEGLSNTILEAMASGLPVVATRVGGADELVDDGVSGLLVPPSDPIALAAALGELTGNRDKRLGMGAAARRRAESEFALSRMIGRYEDMYWRLAKSGDPDGGC